jgi:hypothetical protein
MRGAPPPCAPRTEFYWGAPGKKKKSPHRMHARQLTYQEERPLRRRSHVEAAPGGRRGYFLRVSSRASLLCPKLCLLPCGIRPYPACPCAILYYDG